MRRLRERFGPELVILGVHCGKFDAEKNAERLRSALARHGIDHPVVADPAFEIWQAYTVRAWPTLVLIDPKSRVVAVESGEVEAEALGRELNERLESARRQGELEESPWPWKSEAVEAPRGELAFPSKVTVAQDGRVFVADTGHHRVLELAVDWRRGRSRIARVFGHGEPGLEEGAGEHARFHHPHGLVLHGEVLLVADTDNHAIRRVDLETGVVSTVAGTGQLSRRLGGGGRRATEVALRSPWGLCALDDALLIAMAGSHQLWILLPEGGLGVFAGSGREALVDGPRGEASFNQPSDLAFGLGALFVADSEASAIRAVVFTGEPTVRTLVGQGLFEFGDVDGLGGSVRLQHPTGITFASDLLYVADTYNHKVKVLDPRTTRVETLLGRGRAGSEVGAFERAELNEPEGLVAHDGFLLIADTGNHRLVMADLERRETRAVTLE